MYDILFYRDSKGHEPVKEYILSLVNHETKDNRIKLNKIRDYMKILSEFGTRVGEPYVKHLVDELWELRPARDRILFAAVVGGRFVLLHQFRHSRQNSW
ncbi:type II toxin-antitoxin system RelE/ParE family toxin [Aggregatibacter actinomycetemcomitans]|nr:type II toxin-antitoxin system RelE/ParE family toxin [Aggregatibacter actinomycetemcomitans]